MPKKTKGTQGRRRIAHHSTEEVIEKLFPKKAIDHMRQVAQKEKEVEEPSQSPQQEG
jgi:hypothetical protein